jgi:hypothetical protein
VEIRGVAVSGDEQQGQKGQAERVVDFHNEY